MKTLLKYALLDAAKMEDDMAQVNLSNVPCFILYEGASAMQLKNVAPYLADLSENREFSTWLIRNGFGKAWCVLVETSLNIDVCRTHFRKFLLVKTETGEELYFRFYDPRVLKIFLPTCDKQQLIEFFGPIEKFIVEGDTKEDAIEFSHDQGVLKQKTFLLKDVMEISAR